MEEIGASPIDWSFVNTDFDPVKPLESDTIVWWVGLYHIDVFDNSITMANKELIEIPTSSWISVMNRSAGSGFYMSYNGPLPYRFGNNTPEKIWIYTVGENPYAFLKDRKKTEGAKAKKWNKVE